MRTAHVVVAALLLGAAVLVGWNVGGALLGLGALMTLGYRHGRIPRDTPRPGDPAWEEARARGVDPEASRTIDPEARSDMFAAFRARSRTVDRALKDTSRRARPFLEPWPSMDPRHPRLAEAMDALRRDDGR